MASTAEMQNTFDRLRDQVQQGQTTAAQGNVELVRAKRVHLVQGRLPREVRQALSGAVKRGELGHLPKSGHKPEAYYHPTFEYLAIGERKAAENRVAAAVMRLAGWPSSDPDLI